MVIWLVHHRQSVVVAVWQTMASISHQALTYVVTQLCNAINEALLFSVRVSMLIR